jgi:hypothetical protein
VSAALQYSAMDLECDVHLHSINEQTHLVGRLEYVNKISKYQDFLQQCEADMQNIILKKNKMAFTMELYAYLQNTNLISEDGKNLQRIDLNDFGRIKLHVQSVLIGVCRNAKKKVIGLIEHFDTNWFHKTYMEPSAGRTACETKKIWQKQVENEISRIISDTRRIVVDIKEMASKKMELDDFILDPMNTDFFSRKTKDLAQQSRDTPKKKQKV